MVVLKVEMVEIGVRQLLLEADDFDKLLLVEPTLFFIIVPEVESLTRVGYCAGRGQIEFSFEIRNLLGEVDSHHLLLVLSLSLCRPRS